MSKEEYDEVTKPKGYTRGKIGIHEFLIDQRIQWDEGNIIKYVIRHQDKGGVKDLKKARWFLNALIRREERKCRPGS